jgi:hypothetical protein
MTAHFNQWPKESILQMMQIFQEVCDAAENNNPIGGK